jgi:3-phosphoshikimate 1-carboxyvinyltransferase
MKLVVKKSALNGTVPIPGSKSHTIRAVAIASLAEGESLIRNPLSSGDTLSAVTCYRTLGATIDTGDDQKWKVTGTGGNIRTEGQTIDIGNSGTTLRVAAGSAALSTSPSGVVLTGDHQIQSRPIGPLLTSLSDLGAEATSVKDNAMAPLSIGGTLKGGKTSIECITSQYLTSLLLAAPLAENDTEIIVTLLNEPDYVQMTLDWLDKQQIEYENHNLERFTVKGGQTYKPFDLPVPADFSSATFFLVAGAMLDGEVTLTGLDFSDSQPDKAVADYLQNMGADLTIDGDRVRIVTSDLTGVDIDMNRTPDALPAMAVVGAFAKGTTRLLNVPQARKKETDRIAVMAAELSKLGVKTEELPDGLIVHGGGTLHGSEGLNGHDDHRIVMALSLAAMALDEKCCIDTAEAINVTFPEYVNLMKNIGANMDLGD